MKIDASVIRKYIESPTEHDKKIHQLKVKQFTNMRIHADGEPTEEFLRTYQPSEPDWAITYKKENFRGITKGYISKIIATCAKISRASDFVIRPGEESAKVTEDESLYKYVTKELKITNWFFNEQIRPYLLDPNGVVVVCPDDDDYEEPSDNELPEPKLHYVCSEDILCMKEDLLIVIIDKDKKKYRAYNEEGSFKIDWTGDRWNITQFAAWKLDRVPAVYNGGSLMFKKHVPYYESHIAGVLPAFDQALLENTDKNVSIKMHVYPEKAVFEQQECSSCNGSGYVVTPIVGPDGDQGRKNMTCNTCSGSGMAKNSPFAVHVMRPRKGSEEPLPDWAPAKYIEKELGTLQFLQADIDRLLTEGLRAVNMEFLNAMPADQSGVSKAYDWEQTNLFLYKLAEDITKRFLYEIIKHVNDIRYGVLIPDEEEREKQLPIIPVPQNYEIATAGQMEQGIKFAREAGLSSNIIDTMELQYINRKFAGDTANVNYNTAVITLDPLRNRTTDEELALSSIKAVSQIDLVISANIEDFVSRAEIQVKNFYDLDYIGKMDVMKRYAEEYIAAQVKPVISVQLPQ